MSLLKKWGLNSISFQSVNHEIPTQLELGRVIEQQRGQYFLVTDRGFKKANLSGRFHYFAINRCDFPAVGDFVYIRSDEDSPDIAILERVATRWSWLSRGQAGSEVEEQLICANVDWILIVSSLNQDLNPRRIERTISATLAGKSKPVIVLTKIDLSENWQKVTQDLEARFTNVPVIPISTIQSLNLERLNPYLMEGYTSAMVGSSGVGKSTLINALCPSSSQLTKEVRAEDDRGRHTTTARSMFQTSLGGVIIDSPGVREFRITGLDINLEETFDEIDIVARNCQFRDCTHISEPECAVQAAIARGDIDQSRLMSYHKLKKEFAYWETKHDRQKLAKQKKKWKEITKSMRRHQKHRI